MKTSSKEGKFYREVSFVLPGDPIPAPRPRIRVLRLKNGKSMGVAYYTGKYKTYYVEAPKAISESPYFFDKGTAVQVDVTFYLSKPQKPANPYPVGDIDNLCKSILDAVVKNGSYIHDDAQVTTLVARKIYVTEYPRTEVSIAAYRES